MMISDNSRDYGKFTHGATHNPEKGVPGLFPEVAMVFEVTRLTQLQAYPKKL
jgi:hypothetical protein